MVEPVLDVQDEQIRLFFYLGEYQQAISAAQKSSSQNVEKDVYLYRSYIALKKFGIVLNEINASSDSRLQPVRLLAQYHSSNETQQQQIVSDLNAKYFAPEDAYTWPLITGLINLHERNYEDTLRALHGREELECLALQLHTLLTIDRIDLASKTLKKMQEINDDSVLTQLCTASVNLSLGNDKVQESFYIYQEMIDKWGSSPLLCNGIAAAMFCSGRIPDAESFVQQALDKNSDQAETVINFMFLAHHQGKKSDLVDRYLNQLKETDAKHSFLVDLNNKEEEFDRLASLYA